MQSIAEGVPRFHVPAVIDDDSWEFAVEAEQHGGVEAEFRAFLDAQIETGDLLLDLAPGFGFVALSATTAPAGMPTVFITGLSAERTQALQDAAADAGGWLEEWDRSEEDQLTSIIDGRLEPEGRVFVHASPTDVAWACHALLPFIDDGRLLAISVTGPFDATSWSIVRAALAAVGFMPCALVEQDNEPVLIPCNDDLPGSAIIALPTALVGGGNAADIDGESVTADGKSPLPPASAAADAPVDAVTSGVIEHTPVWESPSGQWNAVRDGLAFIAPHSRTGYGVVGANMLRAMQARKVPVSFFPIGPIDKTLTDNPHLVAAVTAQNSYRTDVPSIRLSQQFDLAMHVGRGPHVAFTIFELDRFSDRERHHMMSQDAVVVCSAWAQSVCVSNGIDASRVHVVPLGVDRRIFHERVVPAATSTDTTFMQVGKLEKRKGQRELLRAFEAAFTPQDPVRLVLACHNPFISKDEFESSLAPFRSSPMASRITIQTAELPTASDVAALMAGADCGVFAVRAEGWNLEALEMLSMGKHIIASHCTAHGEFLNADNAQLITIDAMEDAFPGSRRGQWAAWNDPQHEQLVAALRAVHSRKQQGALPVNTAGIATAEQLSWQHAADTLLTAVSRIA